uniref:Uncharacterized protein n=1 Tax=Arundo donax TaxID=35708 RepID=A0A0A9CAJ9_ARUDO
MLFIVDRRTSIPIPCPCLKFTALDLHNYIGVASSGTTFEACLIPLFSDARTLLENKIFWSNFV